jgi:hypothetical protein
MSSNDVANGHMINARQAIRDGALAGLRNFHRYVLVFIIYLCVAIFGICTCIGWIPLTPLLAFGLWAFALNTLDGQAPISSLWSGFSSFGDVFVRAGLLILLLIVVMSPSIFVAVLLGAAQGFVDGGMWTLVTLLLVLGPMAWNFAIVRLMLAPYFVVEQGLHGIEALKRSWEITEGGWVSLIKIQAVVSLIILPGNLGMQLGQPYIQQATNILENGVYPEAAMQPMLIGFGLMGGSYLFLTLGSAITSAMLPAVYRQLAPKPKA